MTRPGPGCIDWDYLVQFLHDRGVDESAVLSSRSIQTPPGQRPADLLPGCRSVIIFGVRMGDDLFFGTGRETTQAVARFRAGLNRITDDLVQVLREAGNTADAPRSVMVRDGTIRGTLPLKLYARDAGFGSIGNNTLLLSPRFGNRLALSVVLTDKEFDSYTPIVLSGDLCFHCGNCVHSCPEAAVSPGVVDAMRCRNVTGRIPSFLRPLVMRLFRNTATSHILTPLVNHIAQTSIPQCNACVIACPHFKSGNGES